MKDPSEPDPKEMQDRALVTLALGVTENQMSTAEYISDEDLISFYQDQLGNDRRSHVMHAIANDNSTYQRWIDLVQTNELANELAKEVNEVAQKLSTEKPGNGTSKESERSAESKKWNVSDELRSWIRKDRGWTGAFAMGCTAALVAVLAIVLVPQMFQNPTLDELYDHYAMTGSALLPEKSIDLSSGADSEGYTAAQTELAKGIASGFKELGAANLPAEWELDPTRFSDTDINPDRGVESPYALGRLVALSLIQCKLAEKNKYFKSAAPLMRKLIQQNDSFAHQKTAFDSNRSEVCDTSEAIIKMI